MNQTFGRPQQNLDNVVVFRKTRNSCLARLSLNILGDPQAGSDAVPREQGLKSWSGPWNKLLDSQGARQEGMGRCSR